jgi:hypothetical protein
MARHRGQLFAVRVATHPDGVEVARTVPLAYDDANVLINGFNDGETSWVGRVWR